MPLATLNFTLPEEASEHLMALHGPAAFLALSAIRKALRDRIKHAVSDEKTLDAISTAVLDIQHETGVDI